MNKLKILSVMMVVWSLLLVIFAVNKLINPPPIFCWEGLAVIDPITNEKKPAGGCSSKYGQAWIQIVVVFLLWAIIFSILLIFYLKFNKKTEDRAI